MAYGNAAFPKEITKISFDAVEEDGENVWHSLIQNLSGANLEKLEGIFRSNYNECEGEVGLTKTEFLQAICSLYDGPEYSLQSLMLFDSISHNAKETITWNDFLDFLLQNMLPTKEANLRLGRPCIEAVAHGKNESIAKIVLIETDKYFCYAVILKHGRVGLYDGNFNFLTSYHAIITREDLTRPENERRRRNRWITDAIFCPDILMFIITSTARSLIIYEASGLNHVPCWLILDTPNILQCLSYKLYKYGKRRNGKCILYCGDDYGEIVSFEFLQPETELLRRKRNEEVTIFYWDVLLKQTKHVLIQRSAAIHQDCINHIQYVSDMNCLITCSKDPAKSVIIKHVGNKTKPAVFRMSRGASCFALSAKFKLLITGSTNGLIRIWNSVLTSKPIGLISEHQCDILDIQIFERQHLFISCSRDGTLKVWDLKEHACLQRLRLKFPVFRVQGKLIEWGINCIYPGPKRSNPNVWERSSLLISCCNCVAKIELNFNAPEMEFSFSFPVLPPPPLQSSVLIPSDWTLLCDDSVERSEKFLESNIDEQLKEIDFILKRNILENSAAQSKINFKIAVLESKKKQMVDKVAKGAPYLALDLHYIEELKLSNKLQAPETKKGKNYYKKIKCRLEDQLISESSSGYSRPSTTSAEFLLE
ncbi:WD repeat-containing protein on Y chromosome-like [Cylas formicarius]|uniref:WD repeat-containing protein on Y chromosome-like n=1 Tax=Cylas formicarius TaxID=197179 RepID=UPI00295863D9|nr:WD repeat-containing protein on Y chromosome-like [Cylas formicarius]